MDRHLELELLDELPATDPRAARSRNDLRRINAWMRNASIMAQALRAAFHGQAPQHILEIGAGDGQFMLSLAKHLGTKDERSLEGGSERQAFRLPGIHATLLDKQSIVSR